ncbi:beta-xylosidase-like protein [Heterostelium album PN500]|uniref:Beta-xylosidase-like protein n=1 Tax=Heterostelium pallidum (strain ATCC 26659 / Pp 5 / PN500) TaxID=670386 RepID=D3B1D9_HETP5|nr:beta-xylosidase-like protein [Heterostelium album PN500]EFA85113.1 beta-xylosidase-like protein [Heterostelium album PN500]|eukprot:XP_020437222.1 beta-xylosidase-like protein [Heterostelium album PN500]
MIKLLLSFLLLIGLVAAQSVQFQADISNRTEWDHYWERCVGSGHAWLGTRQDWRDALKIAREKLGFERVRFHGIFDDDMNIYNVDSNGTAIYNWYNLDYVYDYIVSLGMAPYVELSFMPTAMASGNATIFHYKGNITPPKDYSLWADLITNFLEHYIGRYGLDIVKGWFFETWNEPNCGFWSGTIPEYFQLLQVTSDAVKAVHPDLMVGGPATCQSQYLPETLEFVKANNVALDFISTHEYPTDIEPVTRNVMFNVLTKSRDIVGPDMPLIYSEYNDGLYAQSMHDNIYASAFAVFNIIDVYGIADIFSWWTFSDVFEEQGQQSQIFNQGFGLQTIYNIPKPSFKAFELLHETGDERASVTGDINHPTAGILVTHRHDEIMVLVYNHNIPGAPISTETISITLDNVPSTRQAQATLRRIDEYNCNPYATWQEMGSPWYPTEKQLEQLYLSASFNETSISYTQSSATSIQFQLPIPPQGVAAIKLKI